MYNDNQLKFKEAIEHLVSFSNEEWKDIASLLVEKSFKKNEIILEAGKIEKHFYFVLDGTIRAFHNKDGNNLSVAFTYTGYYCSCYNSFTSQKPSIYSLQALSDGNLIGLNYENMQYLFNKYKSFERFGRLAVEQALFRMEKREISILSNTAEERFQRLMNDSPHIFNLVPSKHLASYLGMKPETFSRMKKKFFS